MDEYGRPRLRLTSRRGDRGGEHLPASECLESLGRVCCWFPGQLAHGRGQSRRLFRRRFRSAAVLRAGAGLFVPPVRRGGVLPRSVGCAVRHAPASLRRVCELRPISGDQARTSVSVSWPPVCLAVGLYGVAFATSAATMNAKDFSSQESAASRIYFTRLLEQMDAASSNGGQVAVFDTTVPNFIVSSSFAPWNRLTDALPVVRPDVAVDELRRVQLRSVARRSAGAVPVRADVRYLTRPARRGSRGRLRYQLGGRDVPTRHQPPRRGRWAMLHQCSARWHNRRSAGVTAQHTRRLAGHRIDEHVGWFRGRVDGVQRSAHTSWISRSGCREQT